MLHLSLDGKELCRNMTYLFVEKRNVIIETNNEKNMRFSSEIQPRFFLLSSKNLYRYHTIRSRQAGQFTGLPS